MSSAAAAVSAFWQQLSQSPWQHDFFQTLRRLESLHPERPRLGTARRPQDEALRLGQVPDLSFAPAALHSASPPEAGSAGRIDVRFFGLFGPNGPLPLHLTEYARERLMHAGDAGFTRFADLFHHRLLLLFYRAWSQAQPTSSLDRPGDDRFSAFVGSLVGIGTPALRNRDSADDHARLYF
ncbi:type VI secretion system baseplate subunit TssG, partial [Pelomonas sp. HMWF004]